MCGIAGQQDPAQPPVRRDPRMEGVDLYASERLMPVRSESCEKPAGEGLLLGAFPGLPLYRA